MRHIDKTKAIPPLSFLQWLKDNDTDLQAKINDSSVTGSKIWSFFSQSTHVYRELKEALVAYQGYICCYCGQRIHLDRHTVVEHLFAKTKYKHLTLHFCNLLASCKGGCQLKSHVVKSGETLEQIAELHDIDIEHLEEVWVDIRDAEYGIDSLSARDKVVIFPVLPDKEQHCDTKKGSKEIAIHPLQTDCQDYFSYSPTDGKIIVTEKNKLTIERLGLNNNRYINQLRKKTIEQANDIVQNVLMNNYEHSPSILHANRMKIINDLNDTTKRGGKLDPFVFVKIWRLSN